MAIHRQLGFTMPLALFHHQQQSHSCGEKTNPKVLVLNHNRQYSALQTTDLECQCQRQSLIIVNLGRLIAALFVCITVGNPKNQFDKFSIELLFVHQFDTPFQNFGIIENDKVYFMAGASQYLIEHTVFAIIILTP